LVHERFLLREDLTALIERGEHEWAEVTGQK